jgi:streptomycin 6-kinase
VSDASILAEYCDKWSLQSPVPIASTFTSQIYKVSFQGSTAVLKVLNEKGKEFEARGALVLRCFNGNGSVRLLNSDEGAHLLEYLDGRQLKSLVDQGEDAAATEIISDVVKRLHSYSGPIPADLISMERNFRSLFLKVKAESADSIYIKGARVAEDLISTEQEVRVLHGDIHHENILECSRRGWLVIDPQCLAGERTYDLANVFYNPNGYTDLTASPDTIERRCDTFSKRLGLDRQRTLKFAFAYGCLSAAWCIEDGQSPEDTLRIARSIYEVID